MAQDTFAALARRHGDELGHRGVLALGAWSMLHAQRAADLRSRFGEVWSEFDTDDLRTYLGACLRRPVMPAGDR